MMHAGDSYLFQLYAVIDSVSPSMGSAAGGTEVVLAGRGFPDLSLGLGETVVVDVAGSPCTVLSSNFTHIVCTTGPEQNGYPEPQPIDGVWPSELAASMTL